MFNIGSPENTTPQEVMSELQSMLRNLHGEQLKRTLEYYKYQIKRWLPKFSRLSLKQKVFIALTVTTLLGHGVGEAEAGPSLQDGGDEAPGEPTDIYIPTDAEVAQMEEGKVVVKNVDADTVMAYFNDGDSLEELSLEVDNGNIYAGGEIVGTSNPFGAEIPDRTELLESRFVDPVIYERTGEVLPNIEGASFDSQEGKLNAAQISLVTFENGGTQVIFKWNGKWHGFPVFKNASSGNIELQIGNQVILVGTVDFLGTHYDSDKLAELVSLFNKQMYLNLQFDDVSFEDAQQFLQAHPALSKVSEDDFVSMVDLFRKRFGEKSFDKLKRFASEAETYAADNKMSEAEIKQLIEEAGKHSPLSREWFAALGETPLVAIILAMVVLGSIGFLKWKRRRRKERGPQLTKPKLAATLGEKAEGNFFKFAPKIPVFDSLDTLDVAYTLGHLRKVYAAEVSLPDHVTSSGLLPPSGTQENNLNIRYFSNKHDGPAGRAVQMLMFEHETDPLHVVEAFLVYCGGRYGYMLSIKDGGEAVFLPLAQKRPAVMGEEEGKLLPSFPEEALQQVITTAAEIIRLGSVENWQAYNKLRGILGIGSEPEQMPFAPAKGEVRSLHLEKDMVLVGNPYASEANCYLMPEGQLLSLTYEPGSQRVIIRRRNELFARGLVLGKMGTNDRVRDIDKIDVSAEEIVLTLPDGLASTVLSSMFGLNVASGQVNRIAISRLPSSEGRIRAWKDDGRTYSPFTELTPAAVAEQLWIPSKHVDSGTKVEGALRVEVPDEGINLLSLEGSSVLEVKIPLGTLSASKPPSYDLLYLQSNTNLPGGVNISIDGQEYNITYVGVSGNRLIFTENTAGLPKELVEALIPNPQYDRYHRIIVERPSGRLLEVVADNNASKLEVTTMPKIGTSRETVQQVEWQVQTTLEAVMQQRKEMLAKLLEYLYANRNVLGEYLAVVDGDSSSERGDEDLVLGRIGTYMGYWREGFEVNWPNKVQEEIDKLLPLNGKIIQDLYRYPDMWLKLQTELLGFDKWVESNPTAALNGSMSNWLKADNLYAYAGEIKDWPAPPAQQNEREHPANHMHAKSLQQLVIALGRNPNVLASLPPYLEIGNARVHIRPFFDKIRTLGTPENIEAFAEALGQVVISVLYKDFRQGDAYVHPGTRKLLTDVLTQNSFLTEDEAQVVNYLMMSVDAPGVDSPSSKLWAAIVSKLPQGMHDALPSEDEYARGSEYTPDEKKIETKKKLVSAAGSLLKHLGIDDDDFAPQQDNDNPEKLRYMKSSYILDLERLGDGTIRIKYHNTLEGEQQQVTLFGQLSLKAASRGDFVFDLDHKGEILRIALYGNGGFVIPDHEPVAVIYELRQQPDGKKLLPVFKLSEFPLIKEGFMSIDQILPRAWKSKVVDARDGMVRGPAGTEHKIEQLVSDAIKASDEFDRACDQALGLSSKFASIGEKSAVASGLRSATAGMRLAAPPDDVSEMLYDFGEEGYEIPVMRDTSTKVNVKKVKVMRTVKGVYSLGFSTDGLSTLYAMKFDAVNNQVVEISIPKTPGSDAEVDTYVADNPDLPGTTYTKDDAKYSLSDILERIAPSKAGDNLPVKQGELSDETVSTPPDENAQVTMAEMMATTGSEGDTGAPTEQEQNPEQAVLNLLEKRYGVGGLAEGTYVIKPVEDSDDRHEVRFNPPQTFSIGGLTMSNVISLRIDAVESSFDVDHLETDGDWGSFSIWHSKKDREIKIDRPLWAETAYSSFGGKVIELKIQKSGGGDKYLIKLEDNDDWIESTKEELERVIRIWVSVERSGSDGGSGSPLGPAGGSPASSSGSTSTSQLGEPDGVNEDTDEVPGLTSSAGAEFARDPYKRPIFAEDPVQRPVFAPDVPRPKFDEDTFRAHFDADVPPITPDTEAVGEPNLPSANPLDGLFAPLTDPEPDELPPVVERKAPLLTNPFSSAQLLPELPEGYFPSVEKPEEYINNFLRGLAANESDIVGLVKDVEVKDGFIIVNLEKGITLLRKNEFPLHLLNPDFELIFRPPLYTMQIGSTTQDVQSFPEWWNSERHRIKKGLQRLQTWFGEISLDKFSIEMPKHNVHDVICEGEDLGIFGIPLAYPRVSISIWSEGVSLWLRGKDKTSISIQKKAERLEVSIYEPSELGSNQERKHLTYSLKQSEGVNIELKRKVGAEDFEDLSKFEEAALFIRLFGVLPPASRIEQEFSLPNLARVGIGYYELSQIASVTQSIGEEYPSFKYKLPAAQKLTLPIPGRTQGLDIQVDQLQLGLSDLARPGYYQDILGKGENKVHIGYYKSRDGLSQIQISPLADNIDSKKPVYHKLVISYPAGDIYQIDFSDDVLSPTSPAQKLDIRRAQEIISGWLNRPLDDNIQSRSLTDPGAESKPLARRIARIEADMHQLPLLHPGIKFTLQESNEEGSYKFAAGATFKLGQLTLPITNLSSRSPLGAENAGHTLSNLDKKEDTLHGFYISFDKDNTADITSTNRAPYYFKGVPLSRIYVNDSHNQPTYKVVVYGIEYPITEGEVNEVLQTWMGDKNQTPQKEIEIQQKQMAVEMFTQLLPGVAVPEAHLDMDKYTNVPHFRFDFQYGTKVEVKGLDLPISSLKIYLNASKGEVMYKFTTAGREYLYLTRNGESFRFQLIEPTRGRDGGPMFTDSSYLGQSAGIFNLVEGGFVLSNVDSFGVPSKQLSAAEVQGICDRWLVTPRDAESAVYEIPEDLSPLALRIMQKDYLQESIDSALFERDNCTVRIDVQSTMTTLKKVSMQLEFRTPVTLTISGLKLEVKSMELGRYRGKPVDVFTLESGYKLTISRDEKDWEFLIADGEVMCSGLPTNKFRISRKPYYENKYHKYFESGGNYNSLEDADFEGLNQQLSAGKFTQQQMASSERKQEIYDFLKVMFGETITTYLQGKEIIDGKLAFDISGEHKLLWGGKYELAADAVSLEVLPERNNLTLRFKGKEWLRISWSRYGKNTYFTVYPLQVAQPYLKDKQQIAGIKVDLNSLSSISYLKSPDDIFHSGQKLKATEFEEALATWGRFGDNYQTEAVETVSELTKEYLLSIYKPGGMLSSSSNVRVDMAGKKVLRLIFGDFTAAVDLAQFLRVNIKEVLVGLELTPEGLQVDTLVGRGTGRPTLEYKPTTNPPPDELLLKIPGVGFINHNKVNRVRIKKVDDGWKLSAAFYNENTSTEEAYHDVERTDVEMLLSNKLN